MVITNQECWDTIRPDVELLRGALPSPNPQFANPRFWGPAKQGQIVLPNGYKMKWHQCGPGLLQIRLPVMAGNQEAFLCEAYVKDSKLASIMVEMQKSGVDRRFIVEASELPRTEQGVYDLRAMRAAASNDIDARARTATPWARDV